MRQRYWTAEKVSHVCISNSISDVSIFERLQFISFKSDATNIVRILIRIGVSFWQVYANEISPFGQLLTSEPVVQ